MRQFVFIITVFILGCADPAHKKTPLKTPEQTLFGVSLIILGTLQDGGSPHAGCQKKCCENLFSKPDVSRKVVALGIIDPLHKTNYLFEATPDLLSQLRILKNYSPFKTNDKPDGVFLSHAHIGHYAGLMYFGKEVMNADSVAVYAMPRMKTYLETNGPWSQLVSLKNIHIREMEADCEIILSSSVKVTAFLVPHRDEFSETVGYKIEGPEKKVLFIPDIDKWNKWNKSIAAEIGEVDYAFIDGTFYDGKELQNRDMSQVPHPFVTESMEAFKSLSPKEKSKIYFIHLNHTNPLLDTNSLQYRRVLKEGFHIGSYGSVFAL